LEKAMALSQSVLALAAYPSVTQVDQMLALLDKVMESDF